MATMTTTKTKNKMAKGGEIADIEKSKKKLIRKAQVRGLYENFGQKEVRTLEDKYGRTENIKQFDNWASNFDLSQLKEMAKGGSTSSKSNAEMYLDYVNNYLTVSIFASDYNISEEKASEIIDMGRIEHEQNVKNISGGSMAKEGEVNMKVENNKDLEEVAKSMVNNVKKHRWDLKDLIHYFEKDNNFVHQVRVKIWDEMNVYEMPKNYDNILELLKRIVEGNGKKLSNGGSMEKGGYFVSTQTIPMLSLIHI